MAKPLYKVNGTFYLGDIMHSDGDQVSYDGDPGENLIPLNAEAKKAKESAGRGRPLGPLNADERKELEELRALKLKAA